MSATPTRCEISQKFYFDAAHTLRRDIEAEGSRRIHGHTYRAEITLAGNVDPVTGMVVDLGLVRQAIEQLRPQLDHHLLDEVPGLVQVQVQVQVRVWRDGAGDSCTLR